MKKIGFIDYFLHEWHADNLPKWISDASDGEMKVCYAWGEIDNPAEGAKANEVWCEELGIQLCGSIEEVIALSDYLIVLSPDNPERHMDLCRLPLSSGKHTFVDKTFAVCKADAEYMVNYAEKNNTPFFTCSALRYASEYQALDREMIEFIDSRGPGNMKVYAIHQVEPIVYLMGGGASRVLCSGGPEKPTFIFEYSDGRRAVMHLFGWEIGFHMTIHNKDGHSADVKVESDFFALFANDLVRFFKSGEPSFPVSQAIDVAAMLEAGKKALSQPGEWVAV
jgi:hypothetical protein